MVVVVEGGGGVMLGQSCMETNVICASRQTNHPHKLLRIVSDESAQCFVFFLMDDFMQVHFITFTCDSN